MSPATTTRPHIAPGTPGPGRPRPRRSGPASPVEFDQRPYRAADPGPAPSTWPPSAASPQAAAQAAAQPQSSALPPRLRVNPPETLEGIAGARVWMRQLRCRQWIKNLLVFAAPAAADALGNGVVAGRAALAFVVFVLISCVVYLGNDVVDLDEDRRHPVKRLRPVAAGLITIPEALIAAGGCLLVALVSAAMVNVRLLLVVLAYLGVNLAYTAWGRRVRIADLSFVAICFLLRAVAGGVATEIRISPWFIAVVTLAALLVATGKRYGDLVDPLTRRSRAVLRSYNPSLLLRIGMFACAGTLLAYALWAVGGGPTDVPALRELSLVPFSAAIVRYAILARDGVGGAPERLLLEDRLIQLSGALWLMLFLTGA